MTLMDRSCEEDSEEEENYIRRSLVLVRGLSDYFHLNQIGIEDSEEPRRTRNRSRSPRRSLYAKLNFMKLIGVPNLCSGNVGGPLPVQRFLGKFSSKFKHYETDFTINVLSEPEFPLATLSKFAIQIYNAIQEAGYEFVGLVKAYMQATNGDAINFQASIYQAIRRRKTKFIPVHVEYVYPLPPSC